MIRFAILALIASNPLLAAAVDIYNPSDLQGIAKALSQKQTRFASQDLKRYGNHYTMLAYRDATGSSEIHQHEADIFVVVSGEAILLTGGSLVHAKVQAPGELRGTSLTGGERHELTTGSVIHIPAGVPHQLLISEGKPFAYFVVKVKNQ